MVRIEGRRCFVCEALVHQEVAMERVGEIVLVRFRQMYIREINLRAGTTLPFVQPVSELGADLLPMS